MGQSNEDVMKGFVELINTANPQLAATLIQTMGERLRRNSLARRRLGRIWWV
jgi:hypothetical protein